jgi:signal transduction histidine kinase
LIHPDDCEGTRRAWAQAVKSCHVFEFEHRVRRAADGEYRWHLARAVPTQIGGATNWFGTYTDIEDRKQAEKTIRERERMESIGRLAGGIAHDFNNLLVGVLGGASCAMDSLPPTHPAQTMLETVMQAGQQAAELTRRMLAYAGRGNAIYDRANVNELVGAACEKMRPSIPKNIQFDFRGARALPKVRTDAAQLRQIVTELLRNAVEAIGEDKQGAISVTTAVVEVDEESSRRPEYRQAGIAAGTYVSLEVHDTGCGMDGETQKKAFDPFFSTKFVGRGLGLAAVHGFVRGTGGGVQIESAVGQGATLRVLLPAILETEDAARKEYPRPAAEGESFLCQGKQRG